MSNFVNEVKQVFIENSNVEKAIEMKQYMKNLFPFMGIQSPQRRVLSKPFFALSKTLPITELEIIIKELWQLPERELQYLALDIIEQNQDRFEENLIEIIENFIIEKPWWDTVDVLSGKLAGKFFKKYPHIMEEITRRWNQSENIWLNRSSIIFQLSYKSETNTNLLTEFILNHASSKEFFLTKSIGWALREYSKRNKKFVENFIKKNELNALSKREAIRFLNKK